MSEPTKGFSFRPAIRDSVPLLIGLAGGTGSGKTFSALRVAKGIAGAKRFAVIDTEGGRALAYAPPPGQKADGRQTFDFEHGDLAPPFSPRRYLDAINAADSAGYPVVVIDSMSHVWAGDGGCLDMQESEFQRMGGRDAVKMASWIKPKTEHKHMVTKLLQVRAHLILCFRAEPKVEMKRNDKGKMEVVAKTGLTGADGWFHVCEKSLPFELTMSLLLLATAPGEPIPIKLQEQHRRIVRPKMVLDEQVGASLAAWSAGGNTKESPSGSATSATQDGPEIIAARISKKDADSIRDLVVSANCVNEFRQKFGVQQASELPADKLDEALRWVRSYETNAVS